MSKIFMRPVFSEDIVYQVERAYRANMDAYPRKKREVDAFLAECVQEHEVCLRFYYAHMHVNDVVSFSVEQIDAYVNATLEAYELLPNLRSLPEEIFFSYVLAYRVNDEHLDGSRAALLHALLPRVREKNAYDTVLEVNRWCCEQASYMPSDTRTLGPLAMMKSTLGRCGEESVFVVSALRSVGIPARQCYVGRWSHCDDNHAWVEVWIDGVWHYLGGCEPEPALDRGWFTAAASRSMLTYSRIWSCLVNDKKIAYRTPLYTLINSTDSYADCTKLTVNVLDGGLPARDVPVDFQLVNYSELYTIYSARSDDLGEVVFQTGLGDLYIHVFSKDRLITKRVDVRAANKITLELDNGRSLEELDGTHEAFDLVPPAERMISNSAGEWTSEELEKLLVCDKTREVKQASFFHGENESAFSDYCVLARGNLAELDAFLEDESFTDEEKKELLATLRPKDFLDCTAEMLTDTLSAARPYRETVPLDLYQASILSPRVYDEMLLPVRAFIREMFPEGFSSGTQVSKWLSDHVQIVPNYEMKTIYGDIRGVLTYGYATQESFGTTFVCVCRSFGIPARRNAVTMEFEWAELRDGAYVYRDARNPGSTEYTQLARLRLVNHGGTSLPYAERFTIGRFVDGRYKTLRLSELILDQEVLVEVPRGHYALIASTRQIDGTISVRVDRFSIDRERSITVRTPEDATASRIRCVDLKSTLPDGPIRDLLGAVSGQCIMVFADPGKEPTEHLLQELLALREAYNQSGCSVLIMIATSAQRNHSTLLRVETELSNVFVRVADDMPAFAQMHRTMGIGDLRLPFALALDERSNGLFAFANYNINTAQTLLNLLRLSAEREESAR